MTNYSLQTILRKLEEVPIEEWKFWDGENHTWYAYRTDFGEIRLIKERRSDKIILRIFDTKFNTMYGYDKTENSLDELFNKLNRGNINERLRELDENKFRQWVEG